MLAIQEVKICDGKGIDIRKVDKGQKDGRELAEDRRKKTYLEKRMRTT